MGSAGEDEIVISDTMRRILEDAGAAPSLRLEDRGVRTLKRLTRRVAFVCAGACAELTVRGATSTVSEATIGV
jgi:hypothetical protein